MQGVADWSPLTSVTEVRQFLGFTGYYRYFIPNYSKIARPLLDLTKKTTPWHWDQPQFKAFETLKTLCATNPFYSNLTLQNGSTPKPTHLHMAWAPYSRNRQGLTQHHSPKTQNQSYTRWHTTRQHSHQQKGTTTSTKENC